MCGGQPGGAAPENRRPDVHSPVGVSIGRACAGRLSIDTGRELVGAVLRFDVIIEVDRPAAEVEGAVRRLDRPHDVEPELGRGDEGGSVANRVGKVLQLG
jgi:hypothetical protein